MPAIHPDIALFHAPEADRFGNVRIGRRRELATMAHASKATLVTVERISETSLLHDEDSAAGVLPALYVDRIAVVPRGAWPIGLWGEYPAEPPRSPATPRWRGPRKASPPTWTASRAGWPSGMSAPFRTAQDYSQRELLIATIADLLDGVRHVAVGASSPIPAAGAMLLRARNEGSGRETRAHFHPRLAGA